MGVSPCKVPTQGTVVAQKVVDLTLFDTLMSVKAGRLLHIYVGCALTMGQFQPTTVKCGATNNSKYNLNQGS